MKRCSELRQLSSEHHLALKFSRRFARAAAADDVADLALACDEARKFYDSDLAPHFREEETCLLPHLHSAGAEDVVARTLVEHLAMKRLVRELEIPDAEILQRFAELLADHVRFEERELFEAAQKLLNGEVLARIERCCAGTWSEPN